MTQDRFTTADETVVASDGLPALKVGPWWKRKHYYIQRYQEIFSVGMSKRWPARFYIDLFAGPGKCVLETTGEEIDGSPIVAASSKRPFSHYYFVDGESQFIGALEQRIAGYPGEKHFFVGDANTKVQDLVKELPPASSSLGLAFLDPFRWELDFESVSLIASGRRVDLMITFQTGALRRFADTSDDPALANFFGRPNWREDYAAARAHSDRRERALLDVYESGLVRLGYPRENILDDVIVRNLKENILYHIIFASKNKLGRDFWTKVTQKSESGQHTLPLQFLE